MPLAVRISWVLLALIHVMPALVAFQPSLVSRLYGADPAGTIGVLLVHRGALFFAVFVAAAFAALDPAVHRLASLVVGISMISFLIIYAQAGWPTGPLRTIAMTDTVGLVPFAVAAWAAWR